MRLNNNAEIFNLLESIYGQEIANKYINKVNEKIERLSNLVGSGSIDELSEKDTILITYGDSIYNKEKKEKTLKTLKRFLTKYLSSSINTVHILPFFPYSSDDGFSIIDYKKVNEKLGTWSDIKNLQTDFNLMFDLVANHISRESTWFQSFLDCKAPYDKYFITCDKNKDYSQVFRPRALPLLTQVDTKDGPKNVWTTFSSDQIDLNYKNPDLLMEILDIFCFYVEQGASYIRLDAIAFIWKELGTNCLHNEKTHQIIQLINLMIQQAKVNIKIITETNVPHKENISYFGNGNNEASMVYNFPLPPLTLYTFMKQDASIIRNWAATLSVPSEKVNFFNFLASHDGIGLLPAKGIVSDEEVSIMADKVKKIGGFVSYKRESDGKESPYEMNVNFFDALKISGKVETELEIKRFLASQSILLCLKGVPGIYIHSLIGSRNWIEGVKITQSNRAINREKIDINELEIEIANKNSTRFKILSGYKKLLSMRNSCKCFSPKASQNVLNDVDKRVFAIERKMGNSSVICLTNVSNSYVDTVYKNYKQLDNSSFDGTLTPYQVAWLIN